MDNNHNFNDAMLNVRKAYRLLYDYQRMVLDAVNYIGHQYGLRYLRGVSKFSDMATKGSDLDSWAWDWLTMVCIEFVFDWKDSTKFSILLLSDTGHFEASGNKEDKLDTKLFKPAGESQSKIVLIASGKEWEFPEVTSENIQKMLADTLPQKCIDKGLIARCYDISELETITKVNDMLDDFSDKAKESGIKLERISKFDDSEIDR